MRRQRIIGIVCLVFAALLALSGATSLAGGNGPGLDDPSGAGVSFAIGLFLPAMVVLILGIWFFKAGADDAEE